MNFWPACSFEWNFLTLCPLEAFLFMSFQNMASNEDAPAAPIMAPMAVPSTPAKKKGDWERGAKMTPQKRANQKEFHDVMEVRGEQMWCSVCQVPVNHAEKSYATGHIHCQTHRDNVAKMPHLVTRPGPSAELLQSPKSEVS